MDYFELYGLPVSFFPDTQQVKKKYLELSRKFHPDFHALSSPEEQENVLLQSTKNNKAYAVLSNFDRLIKYILKEKHVLEEEEKYTLPQMFLMEMLDLNELVEEAQNDPLKKEQARLQLETLKKDLFQEIEPLLRSYSEETAKDETYAAVKEFYYKRKYLLRIQEQLDTFAAA